MTQIFFWRECNCVWGSYSVVILLMEEILHQLIGSLSHYLQGFIHLRWCRISEPSAVVLHSWLLWLAGETTEGMVTYEHWVAHRFTGCWCIKTLHDLTTTLSITGMWGFLTGKKRRLITPWKKAAKARPDLMVLRIFLIQSHVGFIMFYHLIFVISSLPL